MRTILIAAGVMLMTACSSDSQDSASDGESRYQPTTEMIDLMNQVLDPAADGIWEHSGWEVTEEGETELFPTTEEGWQDMVNAATMVTEAGNLLMIPGRENGADGRGADWIAYSQALVDTGNELIEAAEARDKQAVFDVGGQLYRVCVACHQRYRMPEDE